MLPVESDGKTLWPRHKATIQLQAIRDRVRTKFVARDSSFGVGPSCFVTNEQANGAKELTVDPLKAAMKHSGQEFQDSVLSDYWDFCQTPQDSSMIDAPAVPRPQPKDPRSINGFSPLGNLASVPVLQPAAFPVGRNPEPVGKKRGRKSNAERAAMSEVGAPG